MIQKVCSDKFVSEVTGNLILFQERFKIKNYMASQPGLSPNMRAILVDWMVDIQENFEFNHETLYLGVKLVDAYLSKVRVSKANLQLVGATAMLISAKYDVSSIRDIPCQFIQTMVFN